MKRHPTRHDILVQLRMSTADAVDVKSLLQALDNLEVALYSSDREDVLRVSSALNIPNFVRDAALERLRNYRHQRLRVTEARPGSLEVFAIVTGVAIFVLQKTMGEAFKEGFKETDIYPRLRDFFRGQINAKTLFIAEGVRRAFASKKRKVMVAALPPPDPTGPTTIDIAVEPPHEEVERERIPTLGERLD
jgi:hypothetical protein